MLWFTLNITHSIMLSSRVKISLQYPNIQVNWFKTLDLVDAVDICFTFIQFLGNVIYLATAHTLSCLSYRNTMPTPNICICISDITMWQYPTIKSR